MQQAALILGDENSSQGWIPPRPEDLPTLAGVKRISMDSENSGVSPFEDYVCGISLAWRDPDNLSLKKLYVPVDHAEGNIDPDIAMRWANYVLPGKEIVFANGKYDIQLMRTGSRKRGKFWLDLEDLGVKPRDVAFPAALLDDSPYIDLSLEGIARKYVGRGKREFDGDKSCMAHYPSWMVGPYAEEDAGITLESDEAMNPLIEEEGLTRVLDLENSIIYAVCEIERNGCRIDVKKLETWRREVRDQYEHIIMQIQQLTGLLINPGRAEDMSRLFRKLNLTPPVKVEKKATKKKKSGNKEKQEEKKTERTYEVAELLAFKNPVMNLVVEARRKESLLSKFLDKYHDGLQGGGDILRAQFHQLKTAKNDDAGEGETKGVAWGRFSSAGGGPGSGYNFNAQQVIRPDKQVKELGDTHIIRELFVCDYGAEYGSSDAKQIEYRIFASLAAAKSIIKAYRDDPDTDFHGFVHDQLRKIRPDIDRTTVKNSNFGFCFGASARTTAHTAGISIKEAEAILKYMETLLPERTPFLDKCAFDAEHRGFVSTIFGRRARFKKDDPFYKAVNRVVQGSAADLFKLALRDLYKERKTLGITKLRQIVHDEFNYDKEPGEECSNRIREFLDQQRFDLKIPIRWEVKRGSNWRECH